eukprot:COSAG02_NODE_4398_length_5406_cov_9.442623_2_plen_50_part_00
MDGVDQVSMWSLEDDSSTSFGSTCVNGALDFGGILEPRASDDCSQPAAL